MQDLAFDRETRCGLDPNKMAAYSDFLHKNCHNKVVMDIGCGPGALAYTALVHGAKKVICIDYRPEAINICKHLIEKDFPNKAEYILSDVTKLESLPDADIIIHEILGHAIYDEGILTILSFLKKHNVLHKTFPNYYEMFTYNHNNTSFAGKYTFNEYDFPGAVRRYFDALKEVTPGFLDAINEPKRRLINSQLDIEHENIIHTFSHQDPEDTWGIFDENTINIKNDRMVGIGWRVFFDHEINFTNVPRSGNNWLPLTTEDELKRIKNSPNVHLKNLNYNLYEREKCPFLN